MKTKMTALKGAPSPSVKTPAQGSGGGKPHIRMRHLKSSGGASAFPTAPVGFPQGAAAFGGGGAPDMGGGGGAPPAMGAAGPGAAGGDMGQ